jgi:hypothetical protein
VNRRDAISASGWLAWLLGNPAEAQIGPGPGGGGGGSWNAGTVNAVGSNLTVSSNTLAVQASPSFAGTVTAAAFVGTTVGSSSQVVTVAPFTRPALGSFTWLNQGSATATDHTNGPLTIVMPGGVDNADHALYVAAPGSSPWTLTGQISTPAAYASTNQNNYIFISNGTTEARWGVQAASGGPDLLLYYGTTGYNQPLCGGGAFVWMRLHYDGTNVTGYVSQNGADWWTAWEFPLSDFFSGSVSECGFGLSNGNNMTSNGVSLNNWELTTGNGSSATFQAGY